MNVVIKKAELTTAVEKLKKEGKTVGFVPTMGALHKGHLSLIERSNQDNDATIVSIFVNPTQFNNPKDLETYPRILDKDLELLKNYKVDLVFAPTTEEIYPEKDNRVFDFGILDKTMEGAKRVGHFNGVAQVVSKLFDVVKPDRAYFGMKDFQQLAIIKRLVRDFNYPIEIIPCPIIRESDGLAMSSRNLLLEKEYRENAPLIHCVLKEAVKKSSDMNVEELKQWIIDKINSNTYLKAEYFEIVDDTNLIPVKDWNEDNTKVGCIAVFAGEVRLIDNIVFN